MNNFIRVNFHCHTVFSDGELTPEILAANLAAKGVKFAALTDHDSLEGLPRFQEAMKMHGIAFLPGVELTTSYHGRELHLLGYGFDPHHPELVSTLISLRQILHVEVQSIETSIRKVGVNMINHSAENQTASAAPNGTLEIGEAINLIHRAGGKTIWAHPLFFENDVFVLDEMIADLKQKGLDGIECVYAQFSKIEQELLRELAIKHELLISAGTDFHGANNKGSRSFAIEMLRSDWVKLREACISDPNFAQGQMVSDRSEYLGKNKNNPVVKAHHFRRRSFVLRIFLPTIIAIALFLMAFWVFILPSFENTLIDRKREMIKELTNSALSILHSYERDERNGLFTREEAQNLAISRIETLRYGPEGKDYFWIQDLEPKMVMHPYRPDLNGQDLNDFADPRGAKIFVEFASQVKRSGEGYIDYVWQWKDDPTRLEPKESYVKGFAPWGWIIGTGIYTDDVGQEIARIEQNLIFTSLGISGAIILLLLFVLQQSLRIEKERQEVLDNLRESTDRYHALVEVTTEGTLLVLEGHCRYANPTFLSLLGYTSRQMEFLELTDLLPNVEENSVLWDTVLSREGASSLPGKPIEGFLKRIDGTLVECVFSLNPIEYDDQEGFILLAKDVTRQPESVTMSGLAEASETFPIGLFRARAARRGVFLAINSYGRSLLAQVSMDETKQPALADLFSDPEEYEEFFHSLTSSNNVLEHILHLETIDATARFVSLSARMILDESGQPEFFTGFLRDVTDSQKLEAERESLVTRLQSSLLFLHEPLSTLGRDVVFCPMGTTIQQLSKILTARDASAALVYGGNVSVVGIVTDHDLRARVLAEDLDVQSPIYTIMTAPVSRISETALVYEALMRMEENRVRYLAVEGQGGEIINLVDNKSLIQYQRFAPIVLSREILRANNAEEVAAYSRRKNPLVKTMLASSAQPRHATQLLAAISDATAIRLIQLAIEKIGDPPVPFAFITMGSHGRLEQTLVTDQDNGIIYQDMPYQNPNSTRDYFLRLGNLVCDGLNRAGYPFCRGNIMANNPRWCRSIGEWQSDFDEWVRKSEPQEVMEFTISLDFRIVFGDETLTSQLRDYIHLNIQNEPAFLYQLAQNAVQFKPPFRLLGNVYLTGGSSDNPGEIDLKDALMPAISFARLYALRHHINQTHTIDRLMALTQKNLLQRSSLEEITTAYDFLMRLRLQNQISSWEAGKPINNNIHPARLGRMQQELLKQAFAQIAAIQKKISYDILGGI